MCSPELDATFPNGLIISILEHCYREEGFFVVVVVVVCLFVCLFICFSAYSSPKESKKEYKISVQVISVHSANNTSLFMNPDHGPGNGFLEVCSVLS